MIAKVKKTTKANPSLKNPKLYEELRDQGASAEGRANLERAGEIRRQGTKGAVAERRNRSSG